ncbi:MAG: hypothetical protein KA184_13605 [Candidatus Hydrogenedentes bacterium]|nr:hypothetical protein [Candidatus Hydrogenedentota bacterium]
MLLESPVDKAPSWCSDNGPRAESAVLCQCTLVRNLADFPFPDRCSLDEKESVERRLLSVFDSLNLLSSGVYYSLPRLTPKESRFLVERHLITPQMLPRNTARGVYVAEDQSFSIMVNASEHLCLRATVSGLQPQEAWARLNLMDDTLAGTLDFAFDRRLGYLTSVLAHLGTGLKASTLLHLPCLRETDRLETAATTARRSHFAFCGVKPGYEESLPGRRAGKSGTSELRRIRAALSESLCSTLEGVACGHPREALGDLFLLVNEGTLGAAEEEITFHLRHVAEEILAAEDAARTELLRERLPHVEDRVGRALGVAGGARLLSFPEAMDLLSSIRLGVAAGCLADRPVQELNELLLRSQRAHLELVAGHDCDELTLSVERANLFRSRFGA